MTDISRISAVTPVITINKNKGKDSETEARKKDKNKKFEKTLVEKKAKKADSDAYNKTV